MKLETRRVDAMKHVPKVIYWNNQPSPYVVARFNAVADRRVVDLEAWFEKRREVDRSWDVDESEWRFRARYLDRTNLGSRSTWLPFDELRSSRPDVFILVPDTVHASLTVPVAKACAKRVAFRSLPVFETWTPPTRFRETSKHLLYRSVDGAKVPGELAATMARRYGLPANRIWRVTQSVDIPHFAKAREQLPSTREKRRSALGLQGCVFIYVGRLWSGKGIEYLIEAFRLAQAKDPDMSLLIVGDGSDGTALRRLANGLPSVHFAGFVQPSDLPPWYGISDVMIFPTLGDPNGVVVEEAMAAGLPVLATSSAGDIRSRIAEGVTGFIVPPADPVSLTDKMLELASDPIGRREMGLAAIESVQKFSVEHYAEDFERFVAGLLDSPKRKHPVAICAGLVGQVTPSPDLMGLAARSRPQAKRHGSIAAHGSDPSWPQLGNSVLYPALPPLTHEIALHGFAKHHSPPPMAAWSEELDELIQRRLAATALRYAADLGIDLPGTIKRGLQASAFFWASRTMEVIMGARLAIQALHDAGVPLVVIKGPGIARCYPQAAERPFSDIDILVPPNEFRRVMAVLNKWQLREQDRNRQPWQLFNRWCREAINLEDGKGGSVDVHHRIPPWLWSGRLTSSLLLAESQEVSVAGSVLQCVSYRHNLLIAALHIVSDHNRPGQTIMAWRDLLMLVQTCTEAEVVDAARATALTGWLRWVLEQIPPEAQPEKLLAALRDESPAIRGQRRLRQLMPPAIGSRHLIGQTLRLPLPSAALYVTGMVLPSRSFLQMKLPDARNPYWMWWRQLAANVGAAHGETSEG